MTFTLRALPALIVHHRRVIIALWALLAVAVIPLTRGLEQKLETGTRAPGSESERVKDFMASRFTSPFAQYAVLVVEGLPDPAHDSSSVALRHLVRTVGESPTVGGTFSFLNGGDSLFIGEGGGTFVIVGLKPETARPDEALRALRRITAAMTPSLQRDYPGLRLSWTGELPLTVDTRRVSADDARRAERRVLPLTLIVLIVAFGAAVAAVLPVAIGALAIGMALGAVAMLTQLMPVSILVLNVCAMLGLGLGIDYALLLVSRFREARRRGLDAESAAVEAAAHAGHSILLSGAAVLVGFLALLLVPLPDLRSLAIGGAFVTTFSVLLAGTLLPGVLAALGHRIELGKLRIPSFGRNGFWTRWSAMIVRRPLVVLLVAGAPVAALVWQWQSLEMHVPGGHWLPRSMESGHGLRALREMERSGVVQNIRVVLELPPQSPVFSTAGWNAATALHRHLEGRTAIARARSLAGLLGPQPTARALATAPPALISSLVSLDNRLVLFEVMPAESPGVVEAMELVRELRDVDATEVTGLLGTRLHVGGLPALNVDYGDTVRRATPRVVLLVVLGTLLALMIGFRSVLIPLKAVALNLLSVGAAFGAVVLVFQKGYGISLVGMSAPLEGIFPAVPLLVFCTVFGLSMDYEVFLVSRVAEARRRGASESDAIVEGVSSTGGVITSAGLIMIIVFAAFTAGEFVFMKILGFSLAVAVLLDVTVIRLALGPALLRLAGRWNWWPGVSAAPVAATAAGLRNADLALHGTMPNASAAVMRNGEVPANAAHVDIA